MPTILVNPGYLHQTWVERADSRWHDATTVARTLASRSSSADTASIELCLPAFQFICALGETGSRRRYQFGQHARRQQSALLVTTLPNPRRRGRIPPPLPLAPFCGVYDFDFHCFLHRIPLLMDIAAASGVHRQWNYEKLVRHDQGLLPLGRWVSAPCRHTGGWHLAVLRADPRPLLLMAAAASWLADRLPLGSGWPLDCSS